MDDCRLGSIRSMVFVVWLESVQTQILDLKIVYDNHCSSTTGVAVGLSYEGVPATQSVSIAKLSPPIFMRKKPISPQYEPHELRPIQYSY